MDEDAKKASIILGKYFNTERIDRVFLCKDDKVYSGKPEWRRKKREAGVYKVGDIVGIPYETSSGRSGQVYYPAVIKKIDDNGGWKVRFFKIREGVEKPEVEQKRDEARQTNSKIKGLNIKFSTADDKLEAVIDKDTLDKTNLFLIRTSDDVDSEEDAESEESEQSEEKQTDEYIYQRELDLGYIFCRLESETGVGKDVLMDIKGYYEYIPSEYVTDDGLDDDTVSNLKI